MATKPSRLLIKGGHLIDLPAKLDRVADLAIANGKIVAIGDIAKDFTPDRVIEAKGLTVSRGLVDLCMRVGGESGLGRELQAAAAGGITTLVCPPDTSPVLDEPGNVEMLLLKAEQEAISAQKPLPELLPLGALMRGLQGQELAELVHLTASGCVAFSHGDVPIANTQSLQRALQYAATHGYTVWLHARDAYLGAGGVAASGPMATRLGLSGVPTSAETVALFTLCELVRSTGCRVHVSRLSSAAGVALMRAAKAEGLPMTCDVSIHNLLLCDVDVGYFDTHYRLSPVLRNQRDRDALQAALKDGTIDAIVSDHTPVARDAKLRPFAEAQAGASSVELLLPLALGLARDIHMSTAQMLECLTHKASSCLPLKLHTDRMSTIVAHNNQASWLNTPATITLFDMHQSTLVTANSFISRSSSTPWLGYELQGQVKLTLIEGAVAFESK
jgi:dihydroorotase